jgi:diguanylate cyclase (GGDEF)-like protein
VLFLDLDRFKIINDSLGHAVGDRLLVEIAQQLQACLSESTPIARFGGDEFTIILEDLTNISQASQIGEIICQQLGRTYTLEGYQVFTTVSIGIASNASDRQEPVNLLRDADIALYEAKTRGKSQYVVFNTQMYDKVVTQAQLEQELRQAIDELDG